MHPRDSEYQREDEDYVVFVCGMQGGSWRVFSYDSNDLILAVSLVKLGRAEGRARFYGG
jgi:hypothetical protein